MLESFSHSILKLSKIPQYHIFLSLRAVFLHKE
jgi:hypothetical protein